MRNLGLLALWLICCTAWAQPKTIHVMVALCDNKYQGIVPVPAAIGNGQDPKNNLYWGAGYGLKTFWLRKTTDWVQLSVPKSTQPHILERLLFKHATKDIYLLADAYDGKFIENCTQDFLLCANGQNGFLVDANGQKLSFGGGANLLAYVGHDGLMDFELEPGFKPQDSLKREVMILACYSKRYFEPHIRKSGAIPLLWTTHLMAPEAYTLKSAIDGWILGETGAAIRERAAQTYHSYQKCGLKGARNLFTSGF